MRVALHSVLREGLEQGYLDAHAAIPDDLAESFERLGIHDWSIWRSGRHLFHVVDCDDFAAAMDALDTDPANERWQAHIGGFVDHFETSGDGPAGMTLDSVWTLRDQQNGSATES